MSSQDVAVYSQALVHQLAAAHNVQTGRPYEAFRRTLREHWRRRAGGAEELARLEATSGADDLVATWLSRAQPVYFGGAPLTLLRASWRSLPDWTLRDEDLGAAAGYIWFSEPVVLDAARPGRPQARALLWFPTPGDSGQPGVVVVPFLAWEGGDGQDEEQRGPAEGHPGVPTIWDIGTGRRVWAGRLAGLGAAAESAALVGRLFASCVALLNQTLLRSELHAADRGTRRRAQAALGLPKEEAPPLVRVVLLRRVTPAGGGTPAGGASDAPDWRWRWTVRAHWRKQYYPASGEHRPILVAAHVKGPPDRPLKASTPIWAMTR